ncbi:MAG TPA: PDDEXK nuclease domain-containing protein [Gemmatimonadaceae bacterium]|nr:PDDEXK nuclease domain-containing protein [Gemmatimonadaceae bacterium]
MRTSTRTRAHTRSNGTERWSRESERQPDVVHRAPAGYAAVLAHLKERIRAAQLKASVAVNRELIVLYWDIGREIVERQERDGWGSAVIERLSVDLQREFPGQTGFSLRNLRYARSFYLAYSRGAAILQQAAAELPSRSGATPILPQAVAEFGGPTLPESLTHIPWGHNRLLLDRLDDPAVRVWYARQAAANGWSRSVLALQIQTELHTRLAPPTQASNFDRVLPPPQSDLARAMIKDPYTFDFLELAADATERQLERGLVAHISQFLLELGLGFAYVGRQYRLSVGGDEFFLDLLFYHLVLRCYVVIDLKMEPFKPEFAGKMGFYLAAVDAQLKQHADSPSIGLILCTGKNGVVVEYTLRDIGAPIGVAEYRVTARMPGKLPESLPPTDVLEAEIEAVLAAGRISF